MLDTDTQHALIVSSRAGSDAQFASRMAGYLRDAGLATITWDDVVIPGAVSASIRRAIERADYIVADITEQDPNVMYEIGLAHAWRKPVFLFARNDADSIPSDIAGNAVYVYEQGDEGKLANKARSVIERILSHGASRA